MTDRRRYTTTKTLQGVWTGSVVVFAGLVGAARLAPSVVTLGGASVLWLVGLVALGLRERRHWQRLVAASSFDPGPSGHTADLQGIRHGKSVLVATGVTGLLAPEHTRVRANVDGVDASFTVRIVDGELTDRDGVATGVDELDERFVFVGAEGNVAALLTAETRDALLAVDTPGEYTIRPDEVVYEIPFTRLTSAELRAAGDAVALLASQLETVGREGR